MPVIARFVAMICLAIALSSLAVAQVPGPVSFDTEEGMARFSRAEAKVDFASLANQFEPQANILFCGPATAAMLLNAVHGRDASLPRDLGRIRPEDLRFVPAGVDPVVPRFTQDNVIAKGQKTRAQVLGEPMLVDGRQVADYGYQLRQFDELLRAHGLATRLVVVDDRVADATIRADLVDNLARRGDYVIVNYRRDSVGQQGGGHFSPLGAYDARSDSFLVLDVNPASATWVWLPAAALIKGMRTFDTIENRGYILAGRH